MGLAIAVIGAVLPLCFAVIAQAKVPAPTCFDEIINYHGVKCMNNVFKAHNIQDDKKVKPISEESTKIAKTCFDTVYGKSSNECLDPKNFSSLVTCLYKNSPEIKKNLHAAGVTTLVKLEKISNDYRECLAKKDPHAQETDKKNEEKSGNKTKSRSL